MGAERYPPKHAAHRRADAGGTPWDARRHVPDAAHDPFQGIGNLQIQRSRKDASAETEANWMADDVLHDASGGDLKAAFGERYGVDVSGVRVHTGAAADAATRSLDARAFTVGHDITFGEGELTRDSRGERLLAHELAHVVQQAKTGERTIQREPK